MSMENNGKSSVYTCPMHPEVVTQSPGNCPKCGMKLVPAQGNKAGGRMLRMILICLLPIIVILLLPIFGIQVNVTWLLVTILAAFCVLPMFFMRGSHSKK